MDEEERINEAINTATGICNMSDNDAVVSMAKHIAETLAPMLPEPRETVVLNPFDMFGCKPV